MKYQVDLEDAGYLPEMEDPMFYVELDKMVLTIELETDGVDTAIEDPALEVEKEIWLPILI